MNISLPDPMKRWVEDQAAGGHYGNASDYIRDLIRRDRERKEKIGQMQLLVDEARHAGVSGETMSGIRARALKAAPRR